LIVTVRDLRIRLERALGPSERGDPIFTQFLLSFAERDDMNIADFLKHLRGERPQPARTRSTPPDPSEIVSRLKSAMPSDNAFHSAMTDLAGKKAVTKSVLAHVYCDLFQRKQGVPKKATRLERFPI
jgi:hypothetical protein